MDWTATYDQWKTTPPACEEEDRSDERAREAFEEDEERDFESLVQSLEAAGVSLFWAPTSDELEEMFRWYGEQGGLS
jgi:hypothetical protein